MYYLRCIFSWFPNCLQRFRCRHVTSQQTRLRSLWYDHIKLPYMHATYISNVAILITNISGVPTRPCSLVIYLGYLVHNVNPNIITAGREGMHVWYHLVGKWRFWRFIYANLAVAAMPTQGKRKSRIMFLTSLIQSLIIPLFEKRSLINSFMGKQEEKKEFDVYS
jgi:hypothetical protein